MYKLSQPTIGPKIRPSFRTFYHGFHNAVSSSLFFNWKIITLLTFQKNASKGTQNNTGRSAGLPSVIRILAN